MKLARDGIQLSFDVAGTGSPQFLFVHGLGGDRTHFAPQMEYFARKGRALNAELRSRLNLNVLDLDYSNRETSLNLGPLWDMKWRVGVRLSSIYYDAKAGNPVVAQRTANDFRGGGPQSGG